MNHQQIKFLIPNQNNVITGRRQDGLLALLATLEEHLSSSNLAKIRRLPRPGD